MSLFVVEAVPGSGLPPNHSKEGLRAAGQSGEAS
jgi:hypothetical protein